MLQPHPPLFGSSSVFLRSFLAVRLRQNELQVALSIGAAVFEWHDVVDVLLVAWQHLSARKGASAILAQEQAVDDALRRLAVGSLADPLVDGTAGELEVRHCAPETA